LNEIAIISDQDGCGSAANLAHRYSDYHSDQNLAHLAPALAPAFLWGT
jgi:hypothetical protein